MIRRFVAGCLVGLFASAATADMREDVLTAQIHTANGRYARAVELLEGILREDPQNIPIRMDLAYNLGQLGLWEKSLDAYGRVLDLDPNHPEAARIRSQLILAYGERAELLVMRRRFANEVKTVERIGYYLPLPRQTYARVDAEVGEFREGQSFLNRSVRDRTKSVIAEYGVIRRSPFDYAMRVGLSETFSDSETLVSFGMAAGLHPDPRADYRVSIDIDKPWDEIAEAYLADGRYSSARVTAAYTLPDRHTLNLAYEHRDYDIHRTRSYGRGRIYEAQIARRWMRSAENTAGFADYAGYMLGYYGVRNSFNTAYESAVALARSINQISLNLQAGVRLRPGWFVEGAGFLLHDNSRNIDMFSFDAYGWQASLSGFLSAVLRCEVSYYLSTESTVTGSGKYREIRSTIKYTP